MTSPFFERLGQYFENIAQLLKADANVGAVFPNSSDIGVHREGAYLRFLRSHAPSNCNCFLGGFVFNSRGEESRQIDLLVTVDTVSRFQLPLSDGSSKSFANIDGTIAAVSVKSNLDRRELFDSLDLMASLPANFAPPPASPLLRIDDYDDWPYKIVYASAGISLPTLLEHLRTYYQDHPAVPLSRRPNLIHVVGDYAVTRIRDESIHFGPGTTPISPPTGHFHPITRRPDLQALILVTHEMQRKSNEANHLIFSAGNEFIANLYRAISE